MDWDRKLTYVPLVRVYTGPRTDDHIQEVSTEDLGSGYGAVDVAYSTSLQ